MYQISKNLSTVRRLAGLTQIEFAEIFDIKDRNGKYSNDKVWTYENSKAVPYTGLIKKVATATGVSEDDLTIEELSEETIDVRRLKDYIASKRAYDKKILNKEKSPDQNDQDLRNKYLLTLERLTEQESQITALKKNLDEMTQNVLALGVMSRANTELLLLLSGEKGEHNKSLEILKKYSLEGIFL